MFLMEHCLNNSLLRLFVSVEAHRQGILERSVFPDIGLWMLAQGFQQNELVSIALYGCMITSPHLRSPSFRKQFPRDDLGSWSTLLQRHRFLLTALVLLAFLCTIYLYFAVTLGATESCSGFTGTKKALCHMELAKDSVGHGKLKFF
ncbi:hypothetical protein POTOM_014470 [Populus tomentosa]|uniref:Uncharacterized protein n=1 Tax=Populus tomentosa TaxID=118781 RepID=A0A8X8A4M6_POPTO|nr:hypothetical protein POTOM_014470 [Populus tomentosa]